MALKEWCACAHGKFFDKSVFQDSVFDIFDELTIYIF